MISMKEFSEVSDLLTRRDELVTLLNVAKGKKGLVLRFEGTGHNDLCDRILRSHGISDDMQFKLADYLLNRIALLDSRISKAIDGHVPYR